MNRITRLLGVAAIVISSSAISASGALAPAGWAATPGIVTTAVPGGAHVASLEVLEDGSVGVVATGSDRIIVLKHGPDGALDRSYGTKGVATVPVEGKAAAAAIAVGPDGKVVVAGSVGGDVVAARFTESGKPDRDFNNGKGYVRTDLGASDDAVVGVALSSAGEVFVLATTNNNLGVVKYTSEGKRAVDFGRTGIATTDLGGTESAAALAVRPSGEVLAVGTTRDTSGTESFAMVQYDKEGRLDGDFGPQRNGKVIVASGRTIRSGLVMVLDNAGKIVVAGTLDDDYAAARYTVDGKADAGFGSAGTAKTDLGGKDSATTVGVWQSEITVAGTTTAQGGAASAGLARLDAKGTQDTTYGKSGIAKIAFGGTVAAVVMDSAGRAIITGTLDERIAVARFTTAGKLDRTYSG